LVATGGPSRALEDEGKNKRQSSQAESHDAQDRPAPPP
jgi:hypothetical protein